MEKGKMRANERGVVLMTALAVMLMLSILMSSIVFFVGLNQQTTHENYRENQAYLTASTTLESFIKDIEIKTAPTKDADKLAEQLQAIKNLEDLANANGGKGTTTNVQINGRTDNTDNMGTCTISVAWEPGSTTNIVVTCTATYLGEEQTVAAHISTQSQNKKSDFNNTIEVTGNSSANYDNLKVIGDMAAIDETTGKVFKLSNKTSVYGSYLMQGSLSNSVQAELQLRPSLVNSSMGSNITVTENLTSTANILTISSTMPYGAGWNYVNVGGVISCDSGGMSIGGLENQIDVFASSFRNFCTAGGYTQYGNLYIYKTGDVEGLNDGCLVYKSPNSMTIHGDVVVEGNITIDSNQKLTVDGNLIVGGTISNKDKVDVAGTITENASISKAGRGERPELPLKTNEYVYYPEDYFKGTEAPVGNLSSRYIKLANSEAPTFSEIGLAAGSYSTIDGKEPVSTVTINDTVNGEPVELNFAYKVDQDAIIDKNAFSKSPANKLKILIEVKDDDVMLMFERNFSCDAGGPNFIVKNDSPLNEDGEHQYNCYFVSDSGTDFTVEGIDSISGKSVHTYNTPGSNIQSIYFAGNLSILDYQTYIRAYTKDSLKAFKETMNINDNFVYNPTDVEVTTVTDKDGNPYKNGDGSLKNMDVYKPLPNSIFIFLGQGVTFTSRNNGLIEATVYAPEAKWDVYTSGRNIKVTDAAGRADIYATSHIGVVIAGEFNSDNETYYVYRKPSPTSLLAYAKGARDDTAAGYKLDRYDHY